jgi:hypothetical protein
MALHRTIMFKTMNSNVGPHVANREHPQRLVNGVRCTTDL